MKDENHYTEAHRIGKSHKWRAKCPTCGTFPIRDSEALACWDAYQHMDAVRPTSPERGQA